jgi:predicted nucleic acid-binding protein
VIYLDTSWLVKLYVEESDSAAVRRVAGRGETLLVSEIAFVEFHSAAARRRRDGTLSQRTARAVVRRFRREWADRARISVSTEVIARAADLVTVHALRSIDAVHLASALLVASGAPEPVRVGASDLQLLAAARAEGLPVLRAS